MGAEDKPVSLETAKRYVERNELFCARLLSGLALRDIAPGDEYSVWVHMQTCRLPHESVSGLSQVPPDIVEGI